MNEPFISIIIPAKDAEETIEKCINSIFSINYSNYEVIVVDDGSQDSTLKILERYKDKFKILKTNSKGPSYARNIGVINCKGEFVVFVDADCLLDENLLRELWRCFEKFPEAVSCGGIQKLPSDSTEFERKIFLFMKRTGFISDYMRTAKDERIIEVNHNASCCVMYRKDIFLKEDGFLEGLWPGEDVELDYRLKKKGYKIYFNPKAIVYHYRPKNLKKFLKMMYRYGFAQGFLVRKYGLFRKIHILPLLSLFFLSILFIYRKFMFIFILISLIAVWLYFLSFFSLLLFIVTVVSWHFGFMVGLIRKNS